MSSLARIVGLLLVALIAAASVFGQQGKPRAYIEGTGNVDVRTDAGVVGGSGWALGSAHSTVGAHNQTMELAKDFTKQCPEVTVTLNPTDADYKVAMNHEAFHGLIHKNNQIMVANRRGDLVFSNTSRAVSHSVNDSCAAILSDWKANGRIELPASLASSQPPVGGAQSNVSTIATGAEAKAPPPATTQPEIQFISGQTESVAEAARKNKLRKAQQKSTKSTTPENQ